MALVKSVELDVGFCFYENSLETVKRAVESFRYHVRNIYAIDGKFLEFESSDLLSTPDVRNYLRSIDNVVLVDAPNELEHNKRQIYLDLCNRDKSDYLLIMDADEYITDETDWDVTYTHLEALLEQGKGPAIFGVTLKPYGTSKKDLGYPKIWRCPGQIDYLETHNFWKFRTDGRVFKSSIDWPRLKGIFSKGNDELRDKKYLDESYAYQLKLMKRESPLKMKYRTIAENTKQYDQRDPRLPDGIPLM